MHACVTYQSTTRIFNFDRSVHDRCVSLGCKGNFAHRLEDVTHFRSSCQAVIVESGIDLLVFLNTLTQF